jgi:hypothetical protein
MRIQKIVIQHVDEEREEFPVREHELAQVQGYHNDPRISCIRIRPGRVIVGVQVLPALGELFIQTWDIENLQYSLKKENEVSA